MLRIKQILLLTVALVIAGVMVMLGLWQMQVFEDDAETDARLRAEQPAMPLARVAQPAEQTRDGYGRTVTFSGKYLPERQFVLPVAERPGHVRVLTALERSDGSLVPVVRGEAASADEIPPPPTGVVAQRGLFLASEAPAEGTFAPDQLGAVRLSIVAQRWTRPMVPGFVTLDAPDATAQGLEQADVTLPEGGGSAQNSGYALQWWVFAGFGLIMAGKFARDLGKNRDLVVESPRDVATPDETTQTPTSDPDAAHDDAAHPARSENA